MGWNDPEHRGCKVAVFGRLVAEAMVSVICIAVPLAIRRQADEIWPADAVAEVLDAHHGHLVQQVDGTSVCVFLGVDEAVRATRALQRIRQEAMPVSNPNQASEIRFAIDVGDITWGDDAVSGRPVDTVTALVRDMAKPGLAVTLAVREMMDQATAVSKGPALVLGETGDAPIHYLLVDVDVAAGHCPTGERNPGDNPERAMDRMDPQPEIRDATVGFSVSSSARALEQVPEAIAPPDIKSRLVPDDNPRPSLIERFRGGLFDRQSRRDVEVARRTVRATIWRNRAAAEKRIEEGLPYEAISIYRRLIEAAQTVAGLENEELQMRAARRLVERELLFAGFASLSGAAGGMHLRPGRVLRIGRRRPDRLDGVDIGYDLISRGERQTQIVLEEGKFLVEDLGSRNGTFCGGKLLEVGERFEIVGTVEIAVGGDRSPPRKGACRLRATVHGADHSVLHLTVGSVRMPAEAMAEVAEDWGSQEADSRQSWLFFSGPLRIGGSSDCPVRLPDYDAAEPAAEIEYSPEGFTLAAMAVRAVSVDGVPVVDKVPLRDGAEITIGGQTITIFRS